MSYLSRVLAFSLTLVFTFVGALTPTYADSPWTTLGTRTQLAKPLAPIVGNTDASWQDYNPAELYSGMKTLPMAYLTMRDGVKLAIHLTLPTDSSGEPVADALPTILQQTPYNGAVAGLLDSVGIGAMGALIGGADPYLVQRGYAMLTVDVRGTGQSEGVWEAFGAEEQQDYAEVIDWIAQQPWSNGDVALYGVSYLGITTMYSAAQNHPQVKAAFSIVPIGDGYRDSVFTGGQANALFTPLWLTLVTGLSTLQICALTDAACWPKLTEHLNNALTEFQAPLLLDALTGGEDTAYDGTDSDAFWAIRSPVEQAHKIRVPTFIVGGWHDLFQRSVPLAYEQMKQHTTAKMLIGPWNHLEAAMGAGLPSAEGIPEMNRLALQWFDHYVKGIDVAADKLPNVTQYVKGADKYIISSDWPLTEARAHKLYLHNNGTLSDKVQKSRARHRTYVNNLTSGLCSMSASQWTFGALDLLLGDVISCFTENNLTDTFNLVYELPVSGQGLFINGPIQANMWISSWAKDSSVSVRVSDVGLDGKARALTNGLHMASMRAVDTTRSRYLKDEKGNQVMIQPWHPYTKKLQSNLSFDRPTLVQVEVFPTSAYIAPGHKLRISVGGNNIAQGLPTIPNLLSSGLLTKLYNEQKYPSHVVLPLVPVGALD